jgi:3-hydroxybutyryl-CoA dehydrogenase
MIVVTGSDRQYAELTASAGPVEWLRAEGPSAFMQYPAADAYFNLNEDAANYDHSSLEKPVFINAVVTTLKEMNAPGHVLRINGWNGFLQRPSWELAGNTTENIAGILKSINKAIIPVADEPGFIAARVICMIINEAWHALADEVSTKTEIDTAMKLGTNYPYGPFEWAEIIGLKNVAALLQQLSSTDDRYQPSPLLINAAFKA